MVNTPNWFNSTYCTIIYFRHSIHIRTYFFLMSLGHTTLLSLSSSSFNFLPFLRALSDSVVLRLHKLCAVFNYLLGFANNVLLLLLLLNIDCVYFPIKVNWSIVIDKCYNILYISGRQLKVCLLLSNVVGVCTYVHKTAFDYCGSESQWTILNGQYS